MPEGSNFDLRDWFAAQALNAILSNRKTPEAGNNPFNLHADSIAQEAYGYADAMLRVREKAGAAE